MTTLATLRGYLNDELGVDSDAGDTVFTLSLRNRSISQGYAALWPAGVWKPVIVDLATVADQQYYAVTGLRRLGYAEVIDSAGVSIDKPNVTMIDDGAGGYKAVGGALDAGYTLRLHGWTAYVSTFANDAAVDDLPDELNRVPLLKAKAICYRANLARYARYQERQAIPPEQSVTVDQILGIIAAAEREWSQETAQLSAQRARYSRPRSITR